MKLLKSWKQTYRKRGEINVLLDMPLLRGEFRPRRKMQLHVAPSREQQKEETRKIMDSRDNHSRVWHVLSGQ